MVAAASRAVATGCPEGWEQLSERARQDLGRSLRQLLADLCAQPLQILYAATAAPYDAFIAKMRAGGIERLCTDHPGLERLLATAQARWVEATSEMLGRLAADAPLMEAQAGWSGLGQVVGLETDLSDPHHGGRTVAGLLFDSAQRLIYKPREMRLEQAYHDLLRWLGEHDLPLALRPLQVLAGSGYGWVEAATARPCATAAEVALYYRCAGMLLALWWLLEGADFHMQNVAACGPDPVLLDAETFFQATGDEPEETAPVRVAEQGKTARKRSKHFRPWASGS
jgi:lantibiotic modifying enzyme